MIHFPRNSSIYIPFAAALYGSDGKTPDTTDGSSLTFQVVNLDAGWMLDFASGTFNATPPPNAHLFANANQISPGTPFANVFQNSQAVGTWPRGHYSAKLINSITGIEYCQDFSVGLYLDRRLAYAASHDGTTLTMSVWVEENGVAQTDYLSMTAPTLYNSNGSVATNFTANTAPVNGIFTFGQAISLTSARGYIFEAIASAPAIGTNPAWQFKLRAGLARP